MEEQRVREIVREEIKRAALGADNDIQVNIHVSDMTAKEVADALVPKLKRELFI